MKPSVIDRAMWDKMYDVYVNDSYNLKVKEFFSQKNSYALQEMTAVMLESVRKGYWQPGEQVIKNLAKIHAEWVRDHHAGCTRFICDNQKLKKLIEENLNSGNLKQAYAQKIEAVRTGDLSDQKEGIKLTKKEQKQPENLKAVFTKNRSTSSILAVVGIVVLLFGLSIIKRRQNGG